MALPAASIGLWSAVQRIHITELRSVRGEVAVGGLRRRRRVVFNQSPLHVFVTQ
jgi:hypothetical protein